MCRFTSADCFQDSTRPGNAERHILKTTQKGESAVLRWKLAFHMPQKALRVLHASGLPQSFKALGPFGSQATFLLSLGLQILHFAAQAVELPLVQAQWRHVFGQAGAFLGQAALVRPRHHVFLPRLRGLFELEELGVLILQLVRSTLDLLWEATPEAAASVNEVDSCEQEEDEEQAEGKGRMHPVLGPVVPDVNLTRPHLKRPLRQSRTNTSAELGPKVVEALRAGVLAHRKDQHLEAKLLVLAVQVLRCAALAANHLTGLAKL